MILENTAILNKNEMSSEDLVKLKSKLSIANPMFHKLETMGKPTWATPKRFFYFEDLGDSIAIPIGAAFSLHETINTKNLKVVDKRFESKKKIKIKFKGKLRDYQKETVKKIMASTIGTIQATTGSGKTIIAIKTICERKQPALFLVNTIELANQFIERLQQFTDIKKENIGLIGSGKYEIRDVSVGILQTIVKLDDTKMNEINNHFGQVFVDEVHIVPAATFYKTLNKLKAKYRHGLSATPFRADGLTDVIFFTTGPITHKVNPADAGEHLIIPEVEFLDTEYTFPIFDSSEHAILLTDMATDEKRNKLIYDKFIKVGKDRQSVFLSHRTEQLNKLKELIPDAEILTSKLTKKQRASIMERLHSKELLTVLTTYSLFSTGIDISSLEVIYMCTPMRAERWVVQAVGRLKRKGNIKNKQALVVDFVDRKIEMLRNQYYARKRIWKKIQNQEI